MPVLFSYNLSNTNSATSNRVQSLFERLGWQNVGGSSYRYPPLGSDPAEPEDWFNHVVPALMGFRALVLKHPKISVDKFSLDVQTSTGHDAANPNNPGQCIAAASAATLAPTTKPQFGKKKLIAWLQGTTDKFPYP